MNAEELNLSIRRIKSQDGELLTNCFEPLTTFEGVSDTIETERSLLIIRHEFKAERLFFYTKEFADLAQAFEMLDKGTYYLDIVSKSDEYAKHELESSGFRCIGEMMRLACKDISQVLQNDSPEMVYFDSTIGLTAQPADAEDVYKLLWSVFDTGISHLPDIDEVKRMISDEEIVVHKENGRITALLQEKMQPKRYYINQIYNSSEKKTIHALLLNRLAAYVHGGGKYAYSWVEKNNIASQKFHNKFGFEHDGLWNIVYQLDKNE